MGPALSNMAHLLRLPAGCGEQNMVHFAPNLYILRYLKSVGLEASETERSGGVASWGERLTHISVGITCIGHS